MIGSTHTQAVDRADGEPWGRRLITSAVTGWAHQAGKADRYAGPGMGAGQVRLSFGIFHSRCSNCTLCSHFPNFPGVDLPEPVESPCGPPKNLARARLAGAMSDFF
jgi:hypothetical protein